MDGKRMDALIESWRDEIIEKLKSWIAIPSVQSEAGGKGAPFGEELRGMLDLFLRDAKEMGFQVDDVDGYAGSAEMGAGDKTLGILAHLDVVPEGDGWRHAPYGGEIENGRIYGRGTADDKGPALGALFAMKAVKEMGVPLKNAVRLIVGCDEETGMSDMRHYAKARKMPDYGFSPDAHYPVINIEKGGLSLRLSKTVKSSPEAKIPVYSLWAGIRQNVVPGVARAEVGTENTSLKEIQSLLDGVTKARESFRLSVKDLGSGRALIEAEGQSAHASMPHLGLNAAGMLLIALSDIGAGGEALGAITALSKVLGTEHDGKSLGIACKDELSGELTCNLGLLRYDGNEMTAQLDIRYPLCADETTMCGQAVMAVEKYGLSVAKVGGHTPLHVPAESEIVKSLLQVYHEVTGLPAYPVAIGGGTYSRTMPNTVAFGLMFPGDDDPCHTADEYLDIDKFLLSIRIMAHAIARLAGKEEA